MWRREVYQLGIQKPNREDSGNPEYGPRGCAFPQKCVAIEHLVVVVRGGAALRPQRWVPARAFLASRRSPTTHRARDRQRQRKTMIVPAHPGRDRHASRSECSLSCSQHGAPTGTLERVASSSLALAAPSARGRSLVCRRPQGHLWVNTIASIERTRCDKGICAASTR